jgi:hypothetical protein
VASQDNDSYSYGQDGYEKLYTLTWHAMNNFKSIDSVLEQCKTEQERKFVYKTWDQLTGGGPVYRGQDREHMPRTDV